MRPTAAKWSRRTKRERIRLLALLAQSSLILTFTFLGIGRWVIYPVFTIPPLGILTLSLATLFALTIFPKRRANVVVSASTDTLTLDWGRHQERYALSDCRGCLLVSRGAELVLEIECAPRTRWRANQRDVGDLLEICADMDMLGALQKELPRRLSPVNLAAPWQPLLSACEFVLASAVIGITISVSTAYLSIDSTLIVLYALPGVPLVSLVLYKLMNVASAPPLLWIGSDGILVQRVRSKFLPFSEILEWQSTGISLRGGRRLRWLQPVDRNRLDALKTFVASLPKQRTTRFQSYGHLRQADLQNVQPFVSGFDYRSDISTSEEALIVLTSAYSTAEERLGAIVVLKGLNRHDLLKGLPTQFADRRIVCALRDR